MIAAAHSHSMHGKAFSSLGIPLDPITQDSCIFYGDHTVITAQGGAVVLEIEAGKEMAAHVPHRQGGDPPEPRSVHRRPDASTRPCSGSSRWTAVCQAQLLAMAAGTPKLIPHEMAEYTAEQTGYPLAGWFSFQPLWQEICRTDPDLFD